MLGPGFLESVYEAALAVEFQRRNIAFERQHTVPVFFKGVEVGRHRPDFFVEDEVVVELKAISDFENVHFATVRSYLRAIGRRHGLLLNFAKVTLDVRRVSARADGRAAERPS